MSPINPHHETFPDVSALSAILFQGKVTEAIAMSLPFLQFLPGAQPTCLRKNQQDSVAGRAK